MGLCKCPKKRVSALFCYDHRVTVCESCLVVNHRKCVIRSYLDWLKNDSDYDSNCSLCETSLGDEDCIRLICYDLFHKKCLNERELQLPLNTSPNGRSCPKCQVSIFPAQNLVSPVAEALKTWLNQTSWGRNEIIDLSNAYTNETTDYKNIRSSSFTSSPEIIENDYASSIIQQQHHRNVEKVFRQESPHSILNLNNESINARPFPRNVPVNSSLDRDDNKYKRKTPQEIFSRWSRQFYSPASKPLFKRKYFIIVSGFFIFLVVTYLMYHFGRSSEDDDSNKIHYDE